MKNKKTVIVLSILTIIFTIIGGSLAYYNWQTSESQKTNIVFTVESNFSCAADGGGDITSSDVMLAPASCTNSKYAIKREVTVTPKILGNGLNIDMDLWLDIDDLGEGLSKSKNFKYALTTEENSCTEGVIAEGTFEGKTKEDKIDLLTGKKYNQTVSDKYYLYIWLDAAETSTDTMNQKFNFSLNGMCTEGDSFEDHTLMLTSYSCANETVGNTPYFTYTGDCATEDDGDGNWRIKFLTDGEFTSTLNILIDAFLVGGGGGGASTSSYYYGGGGGGGGYTITGSTNLKAGEQYEIIIGTGGSVDTNGTATEAFDLIANGGNSGSSSTGGSGGNGGGGGGYAYQYSGVNAGTGGSDGNNGNNGFAGGGQGQGTSTYEFGDSSLTLYAGGGGGGSASSDFIASNGQGGGGGAAGGYIGGGETALPNTGGGGGGGGDINSYSSGGSGGSGIVVIRNSKATIEFDIQYTGKYSYVVDGNNDWKIKFLTSGKLTPNEDMTIDVFLVGGGGGGASTSSNYNGGGGGGGGYTITESTNLKAGEQYEIIIGTGGSADTNGTATEAFNLIANGGNSGGSFIGGNGGSGGGGGGYAYQYSSVNAGSGGSNGSIGETGYNNGGTGQGTSTYEFGDSSLTLYSGGGGGGSGASDSIGINGQGGTGGGAVGGYYGIGGTAAPNTGGGGGGGGDNNSSTGGGAGGSGIVVIRKKR